MKKTPLFLSSAVLLCLSIFLTSSVCTPVMYKFDATSSSIQWTSTLEDGKTHKGTLAFKSGNFKFDVKTLLSAYAYINMQSLTCTDVTDAGFNRELITEMRSDEELNLTKFKEATFKITKAKRLDVAEGQPNYDVDGILKLKGIDIPVKFIATIDVQKKSVDFKGNFKVTKELGQLPYDLDLVFDIDADLE